MMMMMAHMNLILRRSQVDEVLIAITKKGDNDDKDDENDDDNVVSYEISSETLTRRGWSQQQAKLEQEGRKKSTLSTILCRARLFHFMFCQRYLYCFQHLFCFHLPASQVGAGRKKMLTLSMILCLAVLNHFIFRQC